MDKALRDKVEKFTFAHNNKNNQREPTEIIIVSTGGDLSQGFEIAKQLLSQNLSVRLVGEGVTLSWAQPDWVSEAENLWLTELGAFHTKKLQEIDRLFHQEVMDWLRTLLGEVIENFDSGRVFLSSALNRLFFSTGTGSELPVLYRIIKLFGARNYYAVLGPQVYSKQLEHIIASLGGNFKNTTRAHSNLLKLHILLKGFIFITAVLLRQTYSFLKERSSRRKLREYRKQFSSTNEPSDWVVLLANQKRLNSWLFNTHILPELKRKKPFGILLTGSLILGEALTSEMREDTAKESWTGLEDFEGYLSQCRIEQAAIVESISELLKVHLTFLIITVSILVRFALKPVYTGQNFKFDFSENISDLLKFLTQDVYRALSAKIATQKATARHNFRETTVTFAVNGEVSHTVVDLILQSAGATTVDFIHGVNGTWVGFIPSQSSIRKVSIMPDLETCALPNQQIVVLDSDKLFVPKPSSRAKPKNILLTTSLYAYYHSKYKGIIPYLPFQEEMLEVVPIIEELFPGRFRFIWRPHPWDLKTAVNRTAERVKHVELSQGRLLKEDLEWADIVISSFSTVLADALCHQVPVFLHTIPLWEDIPAAKCFAPRRRFFRAWEIRDPFIECIKSLDSGDPQALLFEEQIRRKWFGEEKFNKSKTA